MASMLYEVALPGRETLNEKQAECGFFELSPEVKDEMFSCWKKNLLWLADDRSSFESEMDCGRFLFSENGDIYDCGDDDECW